MKGVKHVCLSHGAALRGWLVALALGVVWLNAGAQPVSPGVASNTTAGFGCWYFAGGCKAGVSGSNLAQMPTRATNPSNLSGWVPAGNYGMAPGATGITVNSTADVNIPGAGKSVPVGAASRVTPSGLSRGLGVALGRVSLPLAIGLGVWDLAKELGFNLDRDSSGQVTVTKDDTSASGCWSAPCYEYTSLHGNKFSTLTAAAEDSMGKKGVYASCTGFSIYPYSVLSLSPPDSLTHNWAYCDGSNNGFGSANMTLQRTEVDVTPGPQPVLTSSQQEFLDAVAARSGWPSSSAAARAARQALEHGAPLEIEAPTLTGPASVQGPKTTTQNPDGSSQTKQSVTNITYAGDTITYNTVVTTTNINASGQATDVTTETTEEEKPPEDLCTKNPDTIGCMKLGDVPKDEIPKATKNVTYATEDVGLGDGACPPGVDLGPGRVLSFTPICEKLLLAKPMILAMAALSALLIVMGIRSEGT